MSIVIHLPADIRLRPRVLIDLLLQKSQHEQERWNECTRLIADAVVFYASAILSEVLSAVEKQADNTLVESLQRVTPIAWQHINCYGRYRFDSDLRLINLAEMASQLANSSIKRRQQTA